MTASPYSMSFTTGALLYSESLTVANLYAEMADWKAVRDAVVADNLLQMRTANSSRRITSEVVSRLSLLTPDQLDHLRRALLQEQRYLLWLAVCKRYRFIHEFAAEMVREKYLRMDLTLRHSDYDAFFNNRAEWHVEVARVAASTRAKQRQVVFKMLREAGLLSEDNEIQPVLLPPTLLKIIGRDDPAHLAIFPISDAAVRVWG